MSIKSFCALMSLAMAGILGCSGESSDEMTWKGEQSHLIVQGELNGEPVDFTMDEASAADPLKLNCVREYEVPLVNGERDYTQAKYVETKLRAMVVVDGVERQAEIELKHHDLQADAMGTAVTVTPRVDGVEPASNEAWLEWEWHDEADATIYEVAAKEGTFTVEMFTGTPTDGPVIPADDGMIGGVIDARWSPTEQIRLSFSAPCTKTKINEIE